MVVVFDPTQLQLQVMARCFWLIHEGSRHHQGKTVQLLGGADSVVISGGIPDP